MGEKTKYDLFMAELDSLEKQICALIQRNQELSDINDELKIKSERLKKENEVLKLKLEESEDNVGSLGNKSFKNDAVLTVEDKDLLRKQIDEIVKVIDHHLGS